MNPAIFAGVVVALLASAARNEQPNRPAVGGGAVAAVLVWTIVGPAFVVVLLDLIEALASGQLGRALVALGFVIATAIVLFPWPIARTWLIPAGHVKLTWAITRLSFWVWSGDVRGGAVVAATWAALRRPRPNWGLDAATLEWIENRRDRASPTAARWRLGGAGILATGLLAEARGDRASARKLIGSALELAEPTRPSHAVALASEWLCAEAMERGAWREVEFLARTAPVSSRRLRLLGAVAARLTGIAPLPDNLRLRILWLLAPNRRAMLELLRRALAARPIEKDLDEERPVEPPPTTSEDPLVIALTLHSIMLTREREALDRDDLARLGLAWDRALADPKLERRLLERRLALGTREDESSPDELAQAIRDDLLALVRAAGIELGQLDDAGELLTRAARQLHHELLDDLEITASALESRVKDKRELPAIDEWQTFLALREQYAAAVAVGGLELRRLAFAELHSPVCSLAVWLWNDRSERALGNAIFHWLLAEAVVVDDAEAIRLQERNVDCGI